jgi:hypothetical protein
MMTKEKIGVGKTLLLGAFRPLKSTNFQIDTGGGGYSDPKMFITVALPICSII